MRGVAILLVLAHHLPEPLDHGLGSVAALGGRGVDLFFCLSGFLIGYTCIERASAGRSATRNVRDFFVMRTVRIWPLYFLLLGVIAMGGAWINPAATTALRDLAGYYVLFVSNYVQPVSLELGVLWSLAVEEHFYALVGLVVILAGSHRRRLLGAFAVTAVGLVAVALVYRASLAQAHEAGNISEDLFTVRHFFSTQSRIDQMALGLLTASFFCARIDGHSGYAIRPTAPRTAFILALVVAALLLWPFQPVVGFTALGLAICGAIYLLAIAGRSPDVTSPSASRFHTKLFAPLAFVGKVSYGIYLLHPLTRFALEKAGVSDLLAAGAGAGPALAFYGAWTAVTVGFASVFFFLFERPLLDGARRRLRGGSQEQARMNE